ncbi:SET domain-containing protein SmydA-8-like isoform X2 [Cydia amplana]|uniref:SET domain-containing protein SmydA-8-like isoform X2 n=1 Tax=Cydia amplana TaxID=1869771 RepID=UPI002FE50DF2
MARLSNIEVLKEHLATYTTNATCLSWDVKRSNLGGRGLFATKFIEKGSLIFTNKPLVIGPRADQNADTFCTNCFQINKTCVLCEKCYLMVCSEDCKNSRHAQKCDFISTTWKLDEEFDNKARFMAGILIYLDCLFLSKQQVEMLCRLQKSDSSSVDWSELQTLVPENTIPEEQIKFITMCSEILKINSFRISNHSQKNMVPLRGLYPISAFLNHSCIPNTRNEFGDDYTMAVYASKDIEVGEEIVSSYTGLLWCTPARRIQLYKTKRFWCKCHRCSDSSEMGTRLSALRCLDKECVGILLPVTPLDPRCEWQCDNCEALEPPARVNMVQGVLGSLVATLNLDNQFQLETFVLERLAALIPYSNHIFVDLRLRLALKLGFADDMKLFELSESRLSLKETLCRGTLRTVAALGAGDAHLRGLLLYHLHAALAERARRSPDLFEELKPEIESTIEQAYSILQGDVSAPPDLELRRRYLGPGCDKPQEERFFILDA